VFRLAGYYKDESELPLLVRYTSRNNLVNYTRSEANGYRDVRGFEVTVSKPRGEWFAGFINYTYMIRSTGRFGFAQFSENPADQREYELTTRANIQAKPVPQPYANANIDLFTPRNFGPSILGFEPLADWRIGFLGSWTSGYYFSWSGGGGAIPGLENNVQWRDFWNLDLRFSRTFRVSDNRFNFFIDLNNVFNTRYMTQNGFIDGEDYNRYMRSLHLPQNVLKDLSYASVAGSDRPGDYRKPGVDFYPIISTGNLESLPNSQRHSRPLYYQSSNNTYYKYVEGAWVVAEKALLDRVLDDKAYIDMPNIDTFTFFNPRNVIIGFRLTF
jgi:hypothetical protein